MQKLKKLFKKPKKNQSLDKTLLSKPPTIPMIPDGFKQITYYDENNQPKVALVPEKLNIVYGNPINQKQTSHTTPNNTNNRSSLYSEISLIHAPNIQDINKAQDTNEEQDISEIIDSYAHGPIYTFAPIDDSNSLYTHSDLQSNPHSDTDSIYSNIFKAKSHLVDSPETYSHSDSLTSESDSSSDISNIFKQSRVTRYTPDYDYPPYQAPRRNTDSFSQ
jgi:hypothetical protein